MSTWQQTQTPYGSGSGMFKPLKIFDCHKNVFYLFLLIQNEVLIMFASYFILTIE